MTQTTSAMTGAGADLCSALVLAAADQSDPDAAFRPMHGVPPQLPRRRPSTPSRGALSDRPRVAPGGQTGTARRLPECRRAAGWACRGCISTVPTPVAKSRAALSSSRDGRQTSIPAPPEPAVTRLSEVRRDLCRCLALLGWQQCTSRPLAGGVLSKSAFGPQDEGRCAGAPGTAVESGTRHLFRDPARTSLAPDAAWQVAAKLAPGRAETLPGVFLGEVA